MAGGPPTSTARHGMSSRPVTAWLGTEVFPAGYTEHPRTLVPRVLGTRCPRTSGTRSSDSGPRTSHTRPVPSDL